MQYLKGTDVIPSLEAGLEEMLKACTSGEDTDPIAFLARWLMRNNPRKNPEAAERIAKLRALEVQRQQQRDRQASELAQRSANVATRAAAARAAGEPAPGLLTLAVQLDAADGSQTLNLSVEATV